MTMEQRRWHSLSGAVGFALLFSALFLPGPPPKADDSALALSANLVDHRDALVKGILVAGLALMALLWFFGILGDAIRRNDEGGPSLSLVAVLGGLIGIALMFVGMLLFSGAAFKAANMGDPALCEHGPHRVRSASTTSRRACSTAPSAGTTSWSRD